MRPDRLGAAVPAGPQPSRLIPLALLCLVLVMPAGCSRDDAGRAQLAAARGTYQEIRARAADLEGFFPEMERRLTRERGEALASSSMDLVEEKRRAYDAFLRSARDARVVFEELKASGGEYAEYADRLLALLDAGQAEALLVAESMLQVEEFARRLPLFEPAGLAVFMQRLDDLAGRILSSRDSVRLMEEEAEGFYRSL